MIQHQHETHSEQHPNQQVSVEQAVYPRVEAYLDSLANSVSSGDDHERSESHEEMRGHILSLIEANIELGDSQEQAIEHALAQFGSSRIIQREWRRAGYTRTSMRSSVLTAFGFNGAACLVALTIVPVGIRYANDLGWRAASTITDLGLYALPAAAGLLTGLFAKRRPVLASLYSLLTLMVLMASLDALQSRGLGDSTWQLGVVSQFVIFMLCWIPFGCAGAGVGSLIRWVTHRSKRHVVAR